MFRRISTFGLFLLLAPVALAQRSTAESGYYPPNYAGDMWTGLITRVNDATREITLTFAKGDKTEHFTCVLPEGYKHPMKDGNSRELKPSEIPIGSRVKVYYMRKTRKEGGSKVEYFETFKLTVLPDEGKALTGVLTAADDARGEITLTETPDGKPFVGVLIDGFHVKTKDGAYKELRVSDLPMGARLMVNYYSDTRKVNGKKEDFCRVYRIRVAPRP